MSRRKTYRKAVVALIFTGAFATRCRKPSVDLSHGPRKYKSKHYAEVEKMIDLMPKHSNLAKCTKKELIKKVDWFLEASRALIESRSATASALHECRERISEMEKGNLRLWNEISRLRNEIGRLRVERDEICNSLKLASEKEVSRLEGRASGLIEAFHVIADRQH